MISCIVILLALTGGATAPNQKAKALALAETIFAETNERDAPEITDERRVKNSPMGMHVWYTRSFQQIPFVEARPGAVHFDSDFRVVAFDQPEPVVCLVPLVLPSDDRLSLLVQEVGADHGAALRMVDKKPYYFVDAAGAAPRLRLILVGEAPQEALWLDVDPRTLQVVKSFAPNLQATGRGQIWRRNPTAAAQGPTYGTDLISLDLADLDGSGYLRGAYVDIPSAATMQIPLIHTSRNNLDYTPGMAYEPDLRFEYLPSDLRFEEVSVYYWITSAQHFLQARGYHIREYPILAHPHLLSDSNAVYYTGSNLIAFGDGIIDTAEDADVVVHEYGHAILDEIVGEAFYNDYGAMFHEGFADFFSYLVGSAQAELLGPDRYPEYLGELFGSFRPGSPGYTRSFLHPGYKYPNLHDEPHDDGQLWSSLFFELSETYGTEWVTQLLFETLFRASSARPDQLAQLMLDVDRDLFASAHAQAIGKALQERGFLGAETAGFPILEIGHDLVLDSGELWAKFQVGESEQALELQIEPDPNAFYSLLLAKNRLPTRSDFDKSVPFNFKPWSMTLASSSTRPTLEPGATYYFKLSSVRPVRIRLIAASAAVLPELAVDTPVEVTVASNAAPSFQLTGLGAYSRVLVEANFFGPGPFLVSLATGSPYTYEDTPTSGVAALYVFESGQMLLDLDTWFPGADELFLTVDAAYSGRTTTGVISWTGVDQRSSNPELTLGNPNLVELTPYDRDWYFELTETAPAIKITTDATHPFYVEVVPLTGLLRPSPEATLQEGVYTVILDPQFWVSQAGFTILTSFQTAPGRYGVEIAGNDLGTCPIQVQIIPPTTAPSVPENRQIQRTLLPNELVHYQFELPSWAGDIRIQQAQLEADEQIFVFLHQHDAYNFFRLPWRARLTQAAPLYRASAPFFQLDPFYNWGALFIPGSSYELWFYNSGSSPVLLDAQLSFNSEPTLVRDLVDGMTVQIPTSGFENLFQDGEYQVPFMVNPPPGTKRVEFSFDELQATDGVVLTTYGLDQRIASRPLYQVALDRGELRFDPDQPFLIYFGYVPDSPTSPEPSFRVHVSYFSDSSMNGVLSQEQPVFEGELVSTYPLPFELDIPQGTRKVELSWLATEKPLDVPTRFQAQPGSELPSDLSVLDAWLKAGRSDFTLTGETPFRQIADETWTILQTMQLSLAHFVGYFPGAQPFPFKLAARYSDFASERDFPTPTVVGSATVEVSRFRVVNPSNTAHIASWSQAGISDQHEVPPGGFVDLSVVPGSDLNLQADGPLLVFQAMEGAHWFSLAGTAAFRESSYLLPHVSPDTSDWGCYLACVQAGQTALNLTHYDESDAIEPGLSRLGNAAASSNWFRLGAGLTQDGLFQEATLSAAQFWQNGSQLVQDFPRTKGSHTYFVPHLPDNPAWWSGLVLSNPSEQETSVTIRAFANGQAIPQVLNLTLAPGATKAGVMEQFIPAGNATTALSWMRIDATSDILAQAFIGELQNGDSAGFALPDRDGQDLILPGSLLKVNHGWAIVNTVNQSGSVEVSALDNQGHVQAVQTHPMQAHERWLLQPGNLGLEPGQDYILRIKSNDLRLVGLQLDVEGSRLAGETAQVIE